MVNVHEPSPCGNQCEGFKTLKNNHVINYLHNFLETIHHVSLCANIYTYIAQIKFSHLGWQCSLPESKTIQQIPQHQAREDVFWVICQDFPKDSPNITKCCYCPGSFPEVEGEPPISEDNILFTQDLEASKLKLTCKPLPWGLAFGTQKGTMQASKRGKQTLRVQ